MYGQRGLVTPGLVTPEGVLLSLSPAGLASRGVARLLDLLAQGAVLFAVLFTVGVSGAAFPTWLGASLVIALVFAVMFLYPALSERFAGGRTLGKWPMGLQVVTAEGGPVRFRHALLRNIALLVDLYVLPPGGALGALFILGTTRHQRIGDLIGGTLVVRSRSRRQRAQIPVWFTVPPGWDEWITHLDVSGISPEQYGVLRRFVLRSGEIEVGVRQTLARGLLDDLRARCGLDMPPSVDPDLAVLCVAAAYQRRTTPPSFPPPTHR